MTVNMVNLALWDGLTPDFGRILGFFSFWVCTIASTFVGRSSGPQTGWDRVGLPKEEELIPEEVPEIWIFRILANFVKKRIFKKASELSVL